MAWYVLMYWAFFDKQAMGKVAYQGSIGMHTEIHEHKCPPAVAEVILGDPEKYADRIRPSTLGTDNPLCKKAMRPVQILDPGDLDGAELGKMSAVYVCKCFKNGQVSLVNADMDKALKALVGIVDESQKVATEEGDTMEI